VVVDGVKADAGEDVAVVVDGVGERAALGVPGGRNESAEGAEQCNDLHVDESSVSSD
jgi:hypothetical protein